MFCASEGGKVGSLKRRVRSHLGGWEMNKCTPLWREAHFEVKMLKAPHCRSTFGSCDVEKWTQLWREAHFEVTMLKHTMFGTLLEVETFKKCTQLWREAHFEVKMYKAPRPRSIFGSWDVGKITPLWREAHLWSQKCKKTYGLGPLLDVQMSFCVAGASDSAPCQQWAKHEGFVAVSKTLASVENLRRIRKDACRLAGSVQEACSSEMLGGQGADFLRGVAFWSIRSSGFLRWFCVTGAALCVTWHHFSVAGAILQRHGLEKLQKALVRGLQLCTQLSIFEGDLADLLHFWCCQLRKLRKFRRIASFSTLSSSKIDEVSQKCCVFDVVKFKKWRSLAEKLRFQACR